MNMEMKSIRSQRLNQEYVRLTHKSGLTMLLCPIKGFTTAYAMLGTPYGSVNTCFKTDKDADFVTVPSGIAHFLEHKLFENEDCDAFARYAKTGASANAYTSFDRTCYLFECSDNFTESLEILFDFVTHPYFTKATVDKEQGIIGQEIRMYEDSPEWRVQFNLLGALYHVNPVRLDIAGTVESISEITPDLLYRCYNTFYNLHNMVLTVTGNFSVDDVLSVADRILGENEDVKIEYHKSDEPHEVKERYVEQRLAVSTPMFNIGFKGTPVSRRENIIGSILDEMLIEIIGGDATPLYRKLYDQSLINQTFYGESMASDDYTCTFFSGESRDPQRVYEEICAEIERIAREGISPELFEVAKATIYGRYISAFNTVEGVASLMMSAALSDTEMYELVDVAAGVTLPMLQERLAKSFDVTCSALSVVLPTEKTEDEHD